MALQTYCNLVAIDSRYNFRLCVSLYLIHYVFSDSEGEVDAAKRNINPVKSVSSTSQEQMVLETYSNHVVFDNR